MTFAQASTSFSGGKVGVHSGGFESFITPKAKGSAYGNLMQSNPQAEIAGLLPSAIGGAEGVTRNTQGRSGSSGSPRRPKIRTGSILDYLAAPFGSEEHKFLNYGIEGVDSEKDPETGALSVTNQGVAERGDLVYMMTGLPVFYYPNAPGAAEAAQKLALDIFKIGQDDPSWPLYSQTNVSKSAELGQFGFDRVTAIITGREPLSTLDKAITDWKSRGGDQIRQEFEAS
jgi:putative aldouronate transport system substrate-binding protein